MSQFGWCNDGFHEGRKLVHATNCPGTTARGAVCSCPCHGTRDESTAERQVGSLTSAPVPAVLSVRYVTSQTGPNEWAVIGPEGSIKVSGATRWETLEAAEFAARTANRRKICREAG